MFRTKMRMHTCKVILLTSLAWFLIDVMVLMYYTECVGSGCASEVTKASKSERLVASHHNVISSSEPSSKSMNHEKYQARMKFWSSVPPITENIGWPGEMGKPVQVPPEKQAMAKEKFKLNQFNLVASDMIALNRSLTDVRLDGCKSKDYPKKLPTTSVVIVFHNEAWSTLLRTVWSVIIRSPRSLLEEIILVDDKSEREHLGSQLDDYVKTLPVPVHVITFLDAHCECTEGWLEPLLSRIALHRQTIACPIIDVISDETFEYITASDMTWGGFNWKLNFRWYRVPQREMQRRGGDRTEPLRTPTMAGGLFSIDRDYFYELGAYDEGMDIWGGENLEMSFRVWQCGGVLEIVPCSHVGHVFRDKSPYTFPGGVSRIVLHNAARVAEVWMDEWREFYYSMNPGARSVNVGNVTDRKELRRKLKCKSFRWYLENIYPESQMPLDYYYLGEVRNSETQNCLDTMGRKSGELLGVSYCHGLGGNQVFAYTKRSQIMSDDNCLDASSPDGPVKLSKSIKHKNTGHCLQKPDHRDASKPLLQACDGSMGQQWIMESKFKWQANSV
ncbi:hypothetical protein B566_EDAN007804 [Ephemera danica]|nr:hypothetical protein B566_EDAN007804 [Ephemera danica]